MKKILFFIFSILFFCFIDCKQNRFDAVRLLIREGKIDKAELVLRNLNKQEKKSFDYNYLYGVVLTQKSIAGYKRDALNLFLKANEYYPSDFLNNLMISKMYIEVNSLDNAELYLLRAKDCVSENINDSLENNVFYILAQIYLRKAEYKKALDAIRLVQNQNDFQIKFLKIEIEDLNSNKHALDGVYEAYKSSTLLSDDLKFAYVNYLFLQNRINDAKKICIEFLNDKSSLVNYYGYLFNSFIFMLNKDFEAASNCIEESYNFTVDDSLCLRYKMKTFYTYLTEKDNTKIFNSFLIYKFFYEKNEKETQTSKNDLTDIYDYFKTDVYFNLIKKVKETSV